MLAKRVRDARAFTSADWSKAIARVKGGEHLRKVAKAYGMDKSTLGRRVASGVTSVSRRGPEPRMSTAGEAKLVQWLQTNESIARAVPMGVFKVQAGRIARDIGDRTFKGGRNFTRRFFNRHPELTKRTAEVTEHSRLYAVHPKNLEKYFSELEPLLKDRPDTHIWNFDESGFDGMHIQGGAGAKVIASRGIKWVQTGSDGNRDRIS